jgi:NAD(P)-dependent dehydrogenase (short-subunit alcohol dehydrogenase family)
MTNIELQSIAENPLALPAQFTDLRDKHVFITGAGSGIGVYFLQGFLLSGARVSYVDLPGDHHQHLSDIMHARYGARPHFFAADVRDAAALERAVMSAQREAGPVAVLVNNAANDRRHTLAGMTADAFTDSLNLNLRPHFLTAQFVAKDMAAAGGGAIINMSSTSHLMKMAGMPAYIAAKAAITGLTGGLARELGPSNIRVNALVPGAVLTERQKALWMDEESLATVMAGQSLKEYIQPQDMVCGCLFLASSASRMMTAQTLVIDGGWV